MARSNASTVEEYLKELPQDRREVVSTVRDVIVRNLPKGFQETMNWGMISYEVPLEIYPDTYNGQPLAYASLAAQKNHFALYLMCVYGSSKNEAWLKEEFEKAGKKLDMGKSCVRFRKLEDLPLKAIGKLIAGTSVKKFIAGYEACRNP
ncbi:MAG: DUF1801 domain-containing protein [Planctomycetota bacterium]|nr:DUF1801 domain-containing protein [Planctomycetota bacterium]